MIILKSGITTILYCVLYVSMIQTATAMPVTGGTLDPLTIPKYVSPLPVPPVMNNSGKKNSYNIAVRQFRQQILPGGIWNKLNGRKNNFPATLVWGYGPAGDQTPEIAPEQGSQFNYPAYTIENTSYVTSSVNWINDLKDPETGAHLPHLFAVDQTLHWANPGASCISGAPRTDCRGSSQQAYTGPVPFITHVHGAHAGSESDGYPEAWTLPDPAGSDFICVTDPAKADNIKAFICQGSLANGFGVANTGSGTASYTYPNDQSSATLWYHDHTLGMTRNNVYAGPVGFWLIREPDGGETGLVSGKLPGPAPLPGQGFMELNTPTADGSNARAGIREIPIVIQDRSFNSDGSLFYPGNRAFFEGLDKEELKIPFIGETKFSSDISPIWNPEAFFNTMVVNGVSWPVLEVAQARYRFRLLNGCNSRFLNMALFLVNSDGSLGKEIPIYQIGSDQGLLPAVVKIQTGFRNGAPAHDSQQALLLGQAERADIIVDFSGLAPTSRLRMINTAPDGSFHGLPVEPADPDTTGQVMEFIVNTAYNGGSPTDPGPQPELGDPHGKADATDPALLIMRLPDSDRSKSQAGSPTLVRELALLEEASLKVCVRTGNGGEVIAIQGVQEGEDFYTNCAKAGGVAMGPKAAMLGTNGADGGRAQLWSDPVRQNPEPGATETWEFWNWTDDAHPMHLHLVKFSVLDRQRIGGPIRKPEPTEAGWKDTVIAYPGEVTRIRATFDKEGLYVWHCHNIEHEDNEMMLPYCVGNIKTAPGCAGH